MKPNLILEMDCVYFGIRNGSIKDECPNKKNGFKQCIRLGKACRYLNGEFIMEE